jgi:hypothetical protein
LRQLSVELANVSQPAEAAQASQSAIDVAS